MGNESSHILLSPLLFNASSTFSSNVDCKDEIDIIIFQCISNPNMGKDNLLNNPLVDSMYLTNGVVLNTNKIYFKVLG